MLRIGLVTLLSIFVFIASATTAVAEDDVLVTNKCGKCHAISSLDIAAKNKKSKAPDLAGVGNHHDAAFFKAYLQKEIKHVSHEGCESTKKHMVKVKKELDSLSARLVELK